MMKMLDLPDVFWEFIHLGMASRFGLLSKQQDEAPWQRIRTSPSEIRVFTQWQVAVQDTRHGISGWDGCFSQ